MTRNEIPSQAEHNQPALSVSELSQALKRTVEDRFAHVRVRGEISGFKRHSSGHLYLSLKDADAVIDAVCWRGQAMRLGLKPEDGMEVVVTGRLTTYPGRSKYQLVIESMELAGEGALLKLLEERKRKLAAEGLFDPSRKRPLPFLPNVIGVVTSPTGAVIRDILHRLADRFPRHVLLWPVAVQGEGAAEQVAAAIRGFNALPPGGAVPRPDVLIVARGGGSLEDLWAFNEEVVVRAAAESEIPLISAVGHETDTTLIDFASDLRCPTPTGAAEKAVPVRLELLAQVGDLGARLTGGMGRGLDQRRLRVEGLARGLPNPRRIIEDMAQRLDDRTERLANAMPNLLQRRQTEVERLGAHLKHPREQLAEATHKLERLSAAMDAALKAKRAATEAYIERFRLHLDQLGGRLENSPRRLLSDREAALSGVGKLLESYSYKGVLARGFAYVEDNDGQAVTTRADAGSRSALTVHFSDGSLPVLVQSSAPLKRPRRGKSSTSSDDDQGSLL
ncbi:exodeoxyribonuclease VII large subunit [Telmatospirillum sp. J64-1]|uniref:exodeoxyribonuclease VII large subunit n=1 Tax=Telmatospirillum sp. J64-1 TaxID=2502183 RepID=UPI00115D5814|nr:exodeoxyribonuclease VII large subunit [Telmatospirillum sp. J64-1]